MYVCRHFTPPKKGLEPKKSNNNKINKKHQILLYEMKGLSKSS